MTRLMTAACSSCGAVNRWIGPDATGNYACQQCGEARFKAAAVPLLNERDASAESLKAQAAILERAREEQARADARRRLDESKSKLNLDDERKRLEAAHAKAMSGTAGVNFFPRDVCKVCGACAWLDEEKGRVREPWHDPEKHGVTPGPRIKQEAARVGIEIQRQAAHQRARRSSGDNDD